MTAPPTGPSHYHRQEYYAKGSAYVQELVDKYSKKDGGCGGLAWDPSGWHWAHDGAPFISDPPAPTHPLPFPHTKHRALNALLLSLSSSGGGGSGSSG
jgi:hypothetical protein